MKQLRKLISTNINMSHYVRIKSNNLKLVWVVNKALDDFFQKSEAEPVDRLKKLDTTSDFILGDTLFSPKDDFLSEGTYLYEAGVYFHGEKYGDRAFTEAETEILLTALKVMKNYAEKGRAVQHLAKQYSEKLKQAKAWIRSARAFIRNVKESRKQNKKVEKIRNVENN